MYVYMVCMQSYIHLVMCVCIYTYKYIYYTIHIYFLCWFLVIRLLKPFSSFQPNQLDMCKHGTKYFKISVFGKNKINKNNKKSGCQVGRLRTIFQDFPLQTRFVCFDFAIIVHMRKYVAGTKINIAANTFVKTRRWASFTSQQTSSSHSKLRHARYLLCIWLL